VIKSCVVIKHSSDTREYVVLAYYFMILFFTLYVCAVLKLGVNTISVYVILLFCGVVWWNDVLNRFRWECRGIYLRVSPSNMPATVSSPQHMPNWTCVPCFMSFCSTFLDACIPPPVFISTPVLNRSSFSSVRYCPVFRSYKYGVVLRYPWVCLLCVHAFCSCFLVSLNVYYLERAWLTENGESRRTGSFIICTHH
jgi:hypothetical protein